MAASRSKALAMKRTILCCLVVGVVGCSSGTAVESPADPTVEGPITGPRDPFVAGTRGFTLEEVGYEEAEYFLSGTALSYTNVGELGSDGRWKSKRPTARNTRHGFSSTDRRMPTHSGGTVVVEWLNVSGGVDAAPDWSAMHTEIIREGHVWVGVSAQIVGIEGSGSDNSFSLHLKQVNRSAMAHCSTQAIAFPMTCTPRSRRRFETPLASTLSTGSSRSGSLRSVSPQSAGRLVTYVNAFAPLYQVFDGYVIHSRGGGKPPLSQSPQAEVPTPEVVRVRDDLDDPVLTFQTESDIILLSSAPSTQPDSAMFRLWEVAGTAHADVYTLLTSNSDVGYDPSVAEVVEVTEPVPGLITCNAPINSGPMHWVLKAGLHGLVEWIITGTPLPEADRLTVTADGEFELDELATFLAASGRTTSMLRWPCYRAWPDRRVILPHLRHHYAVR